MTQQPKKPQRKPLGDGIDWSDDAVIDALADVTKADKEAAKTLWKDKAPKSLQLLLDAEVEKEAK